MKHLRPAVVMWLAAQFFLAGYMRQAILNETNLSVHDCRDAMNSFTAGVMAVVLPVSLFVGDPPEVVTYCATQRAERALKVPAPLAESK
jgi:hypothetical protein